ncbi:DUF2254 domain-containing protein [Flaviaesturariibacter terrae]
MARPARLRKLWDTLRASYWFVPSLMMACAAVLWLGTSWLDRLLTASGSLPTHWLYHDDRASVRSLLLTIAASTVGIVGVVFSIMMVPLTIAASQFGPRLLRNFLRDTGTQMTLGTFTATFIFSMLVILQLREEATKPLPQVSVTVGLLLGVTSFAILIFFINHVAVSVQASVVVERVSNDLQLTIDRELPHVLTGGAVPEHEGAISEEPPSLTLPPRRVLATASGYVQVRDDEALLLLACKHDSVLQLLRQPGDFVTAGTAIASVWPGGAVSSAVEKSINAAFILGAQRTLVQDLTFGINELVEVALRALSPAINDPFTAMTCLDWLGTALCRTCGRSFPPARRYDEQGQLRLITSPITFGGLADAAFIQIRDYGRSSIMVLLRMLDCIATVAQCARSAEQRAALLRHARLVEQSAQTGLPDAADREVLVERFQKVVRLLEGTVVNE